MRPSAEQERLADAPGGETAMEIAQSLHDRAAQTLFGLCLVANRALSRVEPSHPLHGELEQIRELANASLRQVREAIFRLSVQRVEPSQLRPSIQQLLAELEADGIRTDLRTWGDLQPLPAEVTDAVYQIVREALVNVRRHSEASSVLVSIRVTPESVIAVIQDDGRGLPEGVLATYRCNWAHLGLRGMEGRAERLGGRLTLAPGDDGGLTVTATIPLKGAH